MSIRTNIPLYNALLPLSAAFTPLDALRRALVTLLPRQHRPELAGLAASADRDLDFPGVWGPPPGGVRLPAPGLARTAAPPGHRTRWAGRMDSCAVRGAGRGSVSSQVIQPAWWCRCCGHSALAARGLCRACYDRRRHSERYFAGHRETVLTRDGCCQVCLAQTGLLVHHRRPGVNRPRWHSTLCLRCHVRVHRRNQLPGFYTAVFLGLWRESHPGVPAQLRLPLAA